MLYGLLADLLVFIHIMFITFVIGGEIAIVIGAVKKWQWIRNLKFRAIHVLAIIAIASEAVFGIACPLTVWENALRRHAGQVSQEDISFVGRLLRDVIFYEFNPWVFSVIYVLFAALVILTFIFVPPVWRRNRKSQSA